MSDDFCGFLFAGDLLPQQSKIRLTILHNQVDSVLFIDYFIEFYNVEMIEFGEDFYLISQQLAEVLLGFAAAFGWQSKLLNGVRIACVDLAVAATGYHIG